MSVISLGLRMQAPTMNTTVNVKQVAKLFLYFLLRDKQKKFHLGLDANLSHFFAKRSLYNLASLKIIKNYLRRLAWT